ncbi:hypothetical protein EDM00_07590 [Ornithobacterium rhinotracheale]|uniref:hypothetical protein n=1 Tax=Ornithobacterium rhinotracheale TaxID=28251 RepID=UPI00129CF843|nr:hypothetical protein [Ornithobacterium rhinotracheale]MRI63851.1 hypothetical protein [Ornithobacterium rhinotracheale]MRJ11014.1 hypothetical protein [Ornithobacterium rhinotracheale]
MWWKSNFLKIFILLLFPFVSCSSNNEIEILNEKIQINDVLESGLNFEDFLILKSDLDFIDLINDQYIIESQEELDKIEKNGIYYIFYNGKEMIQPEQFTAIVDTKEMFEIPDPPSPINDEKKILIENKEEQKTSTCLGDRKKLFHRIGKNIFIGTSFNIFDVHDNFHSMIANFNNAKQVQILIHYNGKNYFSNKVSLSYKQI